MKSTQSLPATYTITNKETGESFVAMPHTFGNGFVLFCPVEVSHDLPYWMDSAKLEADGKFYRFENPNADGKLTSEKYDIVPNPTVWPEAEKGE